VPCTQELLRGWAGSGGRTAVGLRTCGEQHTQARCCGRGLPRSRCRNTAPHSTWMKKGPVSLNWCAQIEREHERVLGHLAGGLLTVPPRCRAAAFKSLRRLSVPTKIPNLVAASSIASGTPVHLQSVSGGRASAFQQSRDTAHKPYCKGWIVVTICKEFTRDNASKAGRPATAARPRPIGGEHGIEPSGSCRPSLQ